MNRIYGFSMLILNLLFKVASVFNTKAKLWVAGRKDIFKQIADKLKDDKFRIWIHVSSLGEFEQGRPLMELLKKEYPDYKIFLTFFSPSGFEVQKNYKFADYIFYLPLDTKSNAVKFVDLINPDIAIFVKYEFWYNHLKALSDKKIPTYLISGIFRPSHAFFKWYGKWYKQILYFFDHFFVQNSESKQLLENIGLRNVTISGDTRFDRVAEIAQKAKPIPFIEKFCEDNTTVIFGSSWKADEELFFDFINKNENNIKFIIAPHEIHEENIVKIMSRITQPILRYSQIEHNKSNDARVLIIDNIGMLSTAYKYGSIAHIGGGFGSGIHNILEAATFGLPILFGPNYHKFQESLKVLFW